MRRPQAAGFVDPIEGEIPVADHQRVLDLLGERELPRLAAPEIRRLAVVA
jgi:hypothetical protein